MSYSHYPITDRNQNWWQLFCIQMGGGIISVPLLSIGPQIVVVSGILNAILSIFIGNLIILFISYVLISMSIKNRLNAVENAQQIVGKSWGRVLAFFILIAMIGWLARQLSMTLEKLNLYPFFSDFNVGPLVGTVAALALLFGVRGLKFVCVVATIILLVLTMFLLVFIEPTTPFNEMPSSLGLDLSGVFIVVGALIASIIDYPTFFRHSKSKKDALTAIFAIFFITILIQIAAILLFKMFVIDSAILDLMNSNNYISIALVVFLIISIIGSASWNMYAASVGWESLFPKFKGKTEYALIGMVAIALFANNQLENFVMSLITFCDIIISGIGGVLIYEFFSCSPSHLKMYGKDCHYNVISWMVATLTTLILYFSFLNFRNFSNIASLVLAFLVITLISKGRKIYGRFFNRT